MTKPAFSADPAPLAITMGDPAGIGPEIIAKFFTARPQARALVIGDEGQMRRAMALVGCGAKLHVIGQVEDAQLEAGRLNLLPVGALAQPFGFGQVSAAAGAAAYSYVIRAIDLAKEGRIGGIVTAPLAKESMKAAGLAYPGHTEILAERSGTSDFAMVLANDQLRVALVSIHVSLREAIALVTPERVLRTIRLAHQACLAYGIKVPRIAVAGLNPHAGEARMFGDEDADQIAPAIAAARAEGLEASGPYPPDTIFMRARQGAFDIVVAQYHDQGLIPVKYLGIDEGVNITIGLPFVRTSVDHGTAFDIAGTGRADAGSLIYAFDQAQKLVQASRVSVKPAAKR